MTVTKREPAGRCGLTRPVIVICFPARALLGTLSVNIGVGLTYAV